MPRNLLSDVSTLIKDWKCSLILCGKCLFLCLEATGHRDEESHCRLHMWAFFCTCAPQTCFGVSECLWRLYDYDSDFRKCTLFCPPPIITLIHYPPPPPRRPRICDSQTIQLWEKFRAIWLVEKLFTTRPQLKLLHNIQVQYVHAIELHTTGVVHAQLALANTFAAAAERRLVIDCVDYVVQNTRSGLASAQNVHLHKKWPYKKRVTVSVGNQAKQLVWIMSDAIFCSQYNWLPSYLLTRLGFISWDQFTIFHSSFV